MEKETVKKDEKYEKELWMTGRKKWDKPSKRNRRKNRDRKSKRSSQEE